MSELSISIENVKRDLRSRLESDKHMSAAWILVPLLQVLLIVILIVLIIAVVIGSALSVASGGTATVLDLATFQGILIVYAIAAFILNIFFSLILHKLVKRRNTHFTRQLFIFEDFKKVVKGGAASRAIEVSGPVNNLELMIRDARVEERTRDSFLWSFILVFAAGASIPTAATTGLAGLGLVAVFAQYYVYYFLMKEWFRHERREEFFFDELHRLMSSLGTMINRPPRFAPIPDRSFAVYFILTIVTLGFFGVYWLYALISDPNNHFRYQAMVEDATLAQLSRFAGGKGSS